MPSKKREKSTSPERKAKAAAGAAASPAAAAAAAAAAATAPAAASLPRLALRALVVLVALVSAYQIRLYAIQNYGLVIHEFDPWFNYRATVYLRDHGVDKFFKWYDHKVWYPLGRPVGTTIYPGMQLTSVAIWNLLGADDAVFSLNDVCCYVPAWFGVLATAFLGMLTYECTGSADAGAISALIMAVVPAHIMRSVGGGYDNESIAMTAMCATFYFWARSLRGDKPDSKSWLYGVVTGLAYIYMVAAWGGYIFVLNMIAFHAAGLVCLGRWSPKLHKAYTLFYVIGTWGAVQVPVVGLTPLKSLEQLGALGVFGLIQLMWVAAQIRQFQDPKGKWSSDQVLKLRAVVFGCAAAAAAVVIAVLAPMGYFGPLSSRVRGLFVQHTRTGNPLVDSVAEHQPASAGAYFQYLHFLCYLYPVGMVLCYLQPPAARGDSKFFVVLYGIIAYYFSAKMVRLVLLMGPIGSVFGGVSLANLASWCYKQVASVVVEGFQFPTEAELNALEEEKKAKKKDNNRDKKKARRNKLQGKSDFDKIFGPMQEFFASPVGKTAKKVGGCLVTVMMLTQSVTFWRYSHRMAEGMSQPSIMFKATLRDGSHIIVDDYREAYWWLRDQTPEDSRVMAWWDYGYQINGIAERTSIADGNTWNHEHIATLGRCLTSPEKRAHKIVRHLADYVLIWAGGGGDDLAKSPHMARIGNSVYSDICPGDPTCRRFGFDRNGAPTPMMAASLLYKLHSHNQKPGVQADPDLFEHVFTSKYGKVRIFRVKRVSRKSKAWIADPKNRVCDAPGSWYCVGQYPPALDKLMAKRTAFSQLEDFNTKKDAKAAKYQEEYMARMAGRKVGDGGAEEKKKAKLAAKEARRETKAAKQAALRKAKKAQEEEDKQDEREAVADEEAYRKVSREREAQQQ